MPPSRGPQKGALVRKLKEAPRAPGVASELFGDGSALLEKANRIQGFLKGQRQRTGGSGANTAWLLAAQQLHDEQEVIEKELTAALRTLQSSTDPELSSFASDSLSEWQGSGVTCRGLRASLKQQVHTVVGMHKSIRQQGVADVKAEAQQLREVVHALKEDSQQESDALARELDQVTREVQELWPTALPGPNGASATPARSVLSLSPAPPPLTRVPSLTRAAPGGAPGPGGLAPIHETGAQWSLAADPEDWEGDGPAGGASGGVCPAGTAWARDAQQLDAMIGCFQLADDTAKARVRVVFAALRQRHQQRLDAWVLEQQAAAAAGTAGAATAAGGAGGPLRGWPEDEHSLFVSLRMKCWRDKAGGRGGGGGASRDALMRQLAVLMPSRTVGELVAHDDWLTNHKIMQRKRRGLLDAWSREKGQFLEDSAALLDESHQMAAARAEQAADRLAHELGREALQATLDDLRGIVLQEAQAAAQAHAVALQALQERQAQAEAVAKEEAAHNKALVAAYRAELQLKVDQEAAHAAQSAAALEAARSAQAEINRERVEWRHAETLIKQDKVREHQAAEEAAAAAREQRLARLRALVAPEVECDPQRVLLPTEASSAVDELRTGGAFRDVHGYTVEQVYRDQRVRVMEALQAAGLHNTQYGRQAVRAAPAATHTRADNLTYDQRQDR